MLQKSEICYTEFNWNVSHGCCHRSPGCQNCWSEGCDRRFRPDSNFGETILHLDRLYDPLDVKGDVTCFIDCNSDLFYEGEADPQKTGVSDAFIKKVLNVVRECPNISFLLLTKRYERCVKFFKNYGSIPENLYIGFSICCNEEVKYIDLLREIPTEHRWISFEPLLSDVSQADGFHLDDIEVAIIGGEQVPGGKARRMKKEWVVGIKQECEKSDPMFYLKQWGDWSETGEHKNTKKNGHEIDGVNYRRLPWPNNKE